MNSVSRAGSGGEIKVLVITVVRKWMTVWSSVGVLRVRLQMRVTINTAVAVKISQMRVTINTAVAVRISQMNAHKIKKIQCVKQS